MASVNGSDDRLSGSTSKLADEKVKGYDYSTPMDIAPAPPVSVRREADELARDVLDIVHRNLIAKMPYPEMVDLVQDLCIFIVERDYKVLERGMAVGKKSV